MIKIPDFLASLLRNYSCLILIYVVAYSFLIEIGGYMVTVYFLGKVGLFISKG